MPEDSQRQESHWILMSADRLDLRFTWPARQDFSGLLAQSTLTWGEDQAYTYELTVLAALDTIRRHPEIGEARPNQFSGCRVYPVERHIIFYRVDSVGIQVVRILHQSQATKGQFDDLS